ncbi:DNA polymerase IV [Aquisalibacillus elongatus]|uniref:DNA polymerase IV n=1 Tax=Aquisalibacillus elongatus TaxID=485577 RepID=A0A3N5BE10_9BACI|nr:DNA polymerase IV [Aquisalibacillus elongatus]RPF55703.1 DNA polymerase-4/DNA polymerase V [Aquisalibacillus elongatus]
MDNKLIFLVDMQSFYASVEKSANPKLQDHPVVVAGDPERRSGIILAACPIAKQYDVETAEALWQAQQKCPDLIIVRPRMKLYIELSYQITQILERFTDQVEVFSVDEQFLDLTGTERLFGDRYTVAHNIQDEIQEELGVYARVGIGPNKVLAKIACDAFAKKNEQGIFELTHHHMKDTMWKLPVGKMFGVGSRMEKHFSRMGIQTIGDLANYPVQYLKKRWGINGEVLSNIANGIDYSPVSTQTHNGQKAVGHHMTLPRDYETLEDIKIVLLELSEEVAKRARAKNYRGHTLSLGLRGANVNDPTGFHRQIKLTSPTNYGMDLFHAALQLLNKHWDGLPVRSVGVTLSQLQSADVYQLSLFNPSVEKDQLSKAMDDIRKKFGQTAIVRASSLQEAGQVFDRAQKIGGHYK